MKVTIFLSSLWLFVASLFSPTENAILSGSVKDQSGELLIGAQVAVQKDRKTVKSTVTDLNGKYRIELSPGLYDVEFAYTGFATQRIVEVKVGLGKENVLDVALENGARLEEVVVTGRETRKESSSDSWGLAPAGEAGRGGGKPTDAKMKAVARSGAHKADKAVEAPKPGVTSTDGVPAETKGSRPEGTGYPVDGIRTSGEAKPATEPMPAKKDLADDLAISEGESPVPGTRVQPAPRAGLLTAGEWNDLHNWNRHWADLLADGETDAFQKMYGFYPRQRHTVMLTNENGFPIADALVQLKTGGGKTVWEARTDNTGKAELWAALFHPEKETAKLHAEVWVNGDKHEIALLKAPAEGFNYLKINAPCHAPKNVDILWAVDATGSMGDEIEYLKTELLDVIGRAKGRNPELAYRMGTVFYRDKGDEYITKSSGLSADLVSTVDFIQKQFAGGGGDYPEAVHSALEEAVFGQKWSENALARICFLVLDASPHQTPEVAASLQKSIREAARKGIRIVPVAASGIQKDTEFLMKFFGLATNGSYVFLTDHSGIGGKHLEPTTDEYKVEPLNHLLVRLITEYASIETCEGKSEIRFENDPQQQPGPVMQALYYPNPAVGQFTLELPFAVQSVAIYDSEGKAVRKVEKPVAGPNLILLNDLAAGFYTIRILNNGLMQSGKLMVVRG